MARKKKEEIKEVTAPATVEQAEISPAPDAKKADEPKKTVRRTRATRTTKTEQKPAVETEKRDENAKKVEKVERAEKAEKGNEAPAAESEQAEAPALSVTEEKTEAQARKPIKRGRKPAVKKAEETSLEAPAERKELKEELKKEEPAPENKKAEEPKTEIKKTPTRAEKNETIKTLVKELLSKRPYKWSELLDESARLYGERVEEKDGHAANDVRGRIGSVFDVMKKDGEVVFEGGTYALKASTVEKSAEKPEKSAIEAEKPQAPVPAPVETEKNDRKEKKLPAVKQKGELAPVFDMTSLLGDKNKTEKKPASAVKEEARAESKSEPKAEEKPTAAARENTEGSAKKPLERKANVRERKTEKKLEEKKQPLEERKTHRTGGRTARSSEEKLKETFLKKIRALGGKYFEFFSIYLLERYSLRNGRRVDGFKVSGGENDGGIDGEIEVTDRLGFRETIYVQAKNWKPIYGKEDAWVIGETTLREFIGAVAYRQAKEGKQHCRGIFITTSYFTAGSKEILSKMSDSFVGYDGDDLFECAKECSFGLIEKNGEWTIDERLFTGEKAFFNLYE